MTFSGWAFYPDGEPADLDLWIDDKRVARCLADGVRDDVGKVFYTNSASKSGFNEIAKIENLKTGPHMAWITPASVTFPICATYFFRGSGLTGLWAGLKSKLGIRSERR